MSDQIICHECRRREADIQCEHCEEQFCRPCATKLGLSDGTGICNRCDEDSRAMDDLAERKGPAAR